MTTFNLLSLPTECLTEICSHLCLHCTLPFPRSMSIYKGFDELRALKSISESCQRLRAIAQPILFHALGPQNDSNAFLWLIVSRPDLGDRTRQIRFNSNSGEDVEVLEDLGKKLNLLLPNQTSPEGHTAWNLAKPTFAFEILLSLLPNLESYTTPIFCYGDQANENTGPFMYSHLTRRAEHLHPRPALPSLRTLTIASGYLGQRADDASTLQPIVALLNAAPNLHRLRIVPFFEGHIFTLDNLSDEALQKVKVMDFLHFPLTSWNGENTNAEIQTFASLCPRLEEVNLCTESDSNPYAEHREFSPTQIILALSRASATLKRIDIDTSDSAVTTDHANLDSALSSLECLESLSLDEQSFCHHGLQEPNLMTQEHNDASCISSILPDTVKHLSIKLGKSLRAIDDVVELGGQVVAGKFTNLNLVDVVFGKYAGYSVDISDAQRGVILGAFKDTPVNVYFRYVAHDTA
ncbi:hypothetical protein VFPPC_11320 [Pochonia chlamydosporia 170]|uniref:F-box domain-containing protein n=1 Tax=Pochonia chlamydosporia 170 TaxID=1380566 RepID=A0A179EY60_METCM|nr:hypothetical protein VFPPC_11320 [Pochonia chlamydosporia 170]OAQ58108.1 hypothetical protein VFPPC_11320 [Pochonia chlamydosporia 170]